MNWNDPAERARLIERVGIDEYERLQQEEFKRQTVEVVNGHAIRRVGSRFGTVYMVDGTNKGHATLEGARKIAREHTLKEGRTEMTELKLNVHLLTWLDLIDHDGHDKNIPPDDYDPGGLHLDGTNLDAVFSTEPIKVKFDYPLDNPVTFEIAGPLTVRDFITAVARSYKLIYAEEDETATVKPTHGPWLLNRSRSDGKYCIWGHDLGDLFLEGAELGKDGVWELVMGS